MQRVDGAGDDDDGVEHFSGILTHYGNDGGSVSMCQTEHSALNCFCVKNTHFWRNMFFSSLFYSK